MYYHIKCCFLVLALSVVYELHCSEICGNHNLNAVNNQRNMMIEQFKYALINDSDQLFTLQKAFLLPRPSDDGICLKAIVTVKGRVTDNSGYDLSNVCSEIDERNGTVCTYLSTEGFELLPATTVTLADFLRSFAIVQMLATLDPSFYYLTRSLLSYGPTNFYYNVYNNNYPTYRSYEFSLAIDKIEFSSLSRIQDDVTDAVQIALSWAKAYSMNGDNPVQGKLDDISWMKDKCSSYDDNSAASILHNTSFSNSQTAAVLIFFTYLLLNVLILALTVLYLGKIFSWIERPQHKYLKDSYKASAIVLAFINLATFGSDILLYILFGGYFTYQTVLTVTVKLFLVTLIFILDIVVSCFYTFKYGHKRKIMHTLALCQNVWFLHRLATDAIISIIAFVVAPAQTLGLITLLLSIIVCAVLFVSSLLQKCQACCTSRCTCERNTTPAMFCTFLIALCTIGLVITVTLLFIVLVDNGLQSAGMGGFILSLIPPTAIFVIAIGLCVNCKIAINFYCKVLTSSSMITIIGSSDTNEADTHVNDQADETTPLNQRSVAIDREDSEDEL